MDPQTSFGARMVRAFRNLLIFTLILGLTGAALYAASLINARTYTLEVRNGQLVVLKGKMMPTGADPWVPADPTLADAYAPLDLQGNVALTVVGPKYAERDELDRALFIVIDMLARPRLESDQPKDLEIGLALVRRAEKLGGLTTEQRASLKKMQSDVAYFLARVRLDDARRQLEEALVQLKLAAESEGKTRQQASLMLLAVEPQVKLLSTTLRATTMTNDAAGGLAKALEPQLQQMFTLLGQQVKEAPLPIGATSPTAALPPLMLTLTKDDKLFLDGVELTSDAVSAKCKEAVAKDKGVRVVIAADKALTYEQVSVAMDLVKNAGVEKFSLNVVPTPAPTPAPAP
ncbi:MAG: biopolymer transporter ExbD [Myxococcaceae bacterium]